MSNSDRIQSPLAEKGMRRFFKNNFYCILSFAVPFVIMFTVYAAAGVHPFGSNQILVTDFWHQYYPFLSEMQSKLQQGGSLLYSWNTGLGSNFLAIIAYYCTSPLNFLTILVPKEWLREAVTLFVITKISCAGLFMSVFLKKSYKKNGPELLLFSLGYALCSFMVGYSWNIMWLDSVALLPLVVLGIRSLFFEKKYKLYIIALALAVISNYYMGFMICVFTALYFFMLNAANTVRAKDFFTGLVRIGWASLIAVAMTAVVLLPAYLALQLAYQSPSKPSLFQLYESFTDILAKFTPFEAPTAKEGLPNIYSGALALLSGSVFLVSDRYKTREKISYVSLLVFLLICCNFKYLNFLWHGAHIPNMLPYRFSFLISFLLVEIAFKAFCTMLDEGVKRIHLLAIAVTAVLYQTLAFVYNARGAAIGCLVMFLLYVVVFCLWNMETEAKVRIPRSCMSVALTIFVVAEAAASTGLGIAEVRVSDYTTYPAYYSTVKPLIDLVHEDQSFQRTETTKTYTLNDPVLYSYRGVSQFSSTAVVNVTTFLKNLGLSAAENANRYYYSSTSEFVNSAFGIKYLIAKDGFFADSLHFKRVASEEYSSLYENIYTLPIGYMTDRNIRDYTGKADTCFAVQNDLFTRMTGIDRDLFLMLTPTEESSVGISLYRYSEGKFSYLDNGSGAGVFSTTVTYTMPADGVLYVYTSAGNDSTSVMITGDVDQASKSFSLDTMRPAMFAAGTFKAGEKVTLTNYFDEGASGTLTQYVAVMDEPVFRAGYDSLRDEGLEVTDYSDTSLKGTVSVRKPGTMFLTVPYEKGWTLYVNGEKTEIDPILGTFIAVDLDTGDYEIELKYSPDGFRTGAVISVSAILIFAAICVTDTVIKRKKKDGNSPAGNEGKE